MIITDKSIDGGKAFDFGKTSKDYALFRDIYPDVFYKKIVDRGLCQNRQRVLDLGTGTGVLPRNMYKFGAQWTGIDISEEQISFARKMARENAMNIEFKAVPAEGISFPRESFDVITACQCFMYFDHEKLFPLLNSILKPNGKLLILYMAWLPYEDKIAGESEKLVLKYTPGWTGAGEVRHHIQIPDIAKNYFTLLDSELYDVNVPFTRESWHGRMRSCRGVGASLSESEIYAWNKEHKELLEKIAPHEFDVLHYASLAVLGKTKTTGVYKML